MSDRSAKPTAEMDVTWPTETIRFANIHIDGKHVLSIGKLDNGRFAIYNADEFEGIDVLAEPLSKVRDRLEPLRRIWKVDAGYDTEEEEAKMALPNADVTRKNVLVGEPERGRHSLFGHSTDERGLVAGTRLKDEILDAILDSLVDKPNQIKSYTAAETERIAAEFDVKKFAVAGVRASLTKGMYGDTVENLVAARRAQRSRVRHPPAPLHEQVIGIRRP